MRNDFFGGSVESSSNDYDWVTCKGVAQFFVFFRRPMSAVYPFRLAFLAHINFGFSNYASCGLVRSGRREASD
ncbi:hypothetical protein APY04_0191 [Hyphomicrobium sulfonivorans]|uniref:Uncharacterized protein n=1 Tax=Hyphomicrobium sulfonivorans TaxID=121290 RepID=A0A109BP62_HYPSL|nr:hypothetical protein APY04_0191 [Hyphomicrobium sulfonivorans]